ncbi:M48 family metalloprotease [Desulfonatronospira sp.]|uniref:M48 family metalloprotease n=1 Tax=Desulfonatronospira sp. TaxID=1962951 RepID=UPI0025BBFF97|nr:M48 family metalloprotease [Desulfonatronospira sp.]
MIVKQFEKTSRRLSRRHFLYLAGAGSLYLVAGCATHPVTGRSQFMLMSESQEIEVDKTNSPHQISADYGVVQDRNLNSYVAGVGQDIASKSHRPQMPYSFNTLNAPYINAYAFPGGTIGITRGILLELQDEAELASLIGHEVGHVTARHTAQRMTRGMLASLVFAGAAAAAGPQWEGVVAGLGNIGAGALLASYSRNQEREADELGLEYMARSDYNPEGFIGLMKMLKELSGEDRAALDLLFSTHPMSSERYQTAVNRVRSDYAKNSKPLYRERYMDNTAGLRKIKKAVQEMQAGDDLMMQEQRQKARQSYDSALRAAPGDYAANLKMAKCLLSLENSSEAKKFARAAHEIYPREPQSRHVMGIACIRENNYEQALEEFSAYHEQLPGNPNTVFFQGYSLEGMSRRSQAAQKYSAYLQQVNQGQYAEHAYNRLQEWGYI